MDSEFLLMYCDRIASGSVKIWTQKSIAKAGFKPKFTAFYLKIESLFFNEK